MTTAEKLYKIEAQIRKDIPRLMELRAGCILEYFTGVKHKVVSQYYFNGKRKYALVNIGSGLVIHISEDEIFEKKYFSIIGHEIMLNDVLEWLNYIIYEKCIPITDLGYSGMVKQFYVKGDDGSIIFEILDLKNPDLGLDIIRIGLWDLSKPLLKDQSEELIKFLYNIQNK
ncbi:hypothetical protein RCZ02_16580 [Capnocytophaga felis]|uniref:hypothetical protein n=1 Tax=Capnocytophaga felis TaxID=2267611 RepID=UPI0012C0231A|nr:hypothetical protein [Capnocytophaga felis]GET48827.1 hypothetical protein RCZ02_16580 [Capnocytophaga felis]